MLKVGTDMQKFLNVKEMHRLLYGYNGFVIFTLMAFMCLTQERIYQAMTARAFLESAGAVPPASDVIFFTTTVYFGWVFLQKKSTATC